MSDEVVDVTFEAMIELGAPAPAPKTQPSPKPIREVDPAALVPALNTAPMGAHTLADCGFHPQVLVEEHTGRVYCRVCDQTLDAVMVLLEFARRERNFCYSVNHLRTEAQALRTEVAVLKVERSRLRSDIKKRSGKR